MTILYHLAELSLYITIGYMFVNLMLDNEIE